MKFNPTKSCLFTIGDDVEEYIRNLQIGSHDVSWIDSRKCLGMYCN